MWISRYIVEFIVFSFLGWVWESIYVSLVNKKWENRGFLYGPICPIYGVGAISGVGLVELLSVFGYPPLNWWQVLLIGFFGSIVLEYSTSVILEKLFHARWWDYSEMPLNINGRICFPASCGFAAAGLLVVYVFAPACLYISSFIPPVIMELAALIMIALLSVDMTLTISELTDFDKTVREVESTFNDKMTDAADEFFKNARQFQNKAVTRIKCFKYPKANGLNRILERIKDKINDNKD